MAATKGKDGAIYAGSTSSTGALGDIDSWNLNPTIEVADITSYGSSFRQRAQTIKDWTVEASGTLNRADAKQADLLAQFESGATDTSVLFKLFTTTSRTTKYWSGTGVLTGGTITSSVADKVAVTFSLSANGALTWTGA